MIIWDSVVNLVSQGVGFWRDSREQKHELKKVERKAETDFRIAEFNARINLMTKQEDNDAQYDLQALRNRDRSYIDEVLIAAFSALVAMHFIPGTQPYMHEGWSAMGYQAAPWWFEFGMVGILVSTLGLMRLVRVFLAQVSLNRKAKK